MFASMKRSALILSAVAGAALMSDAALAETYTIDNAHSSVNFRIRHLISKTRGRFDKYTGTIDYDAKNLKNSKVTAEIEAASINTDNEKRDEHLRSADFFDVSNHPKITFVSTKVTDVKGKKGKLHGNLTMHGVTKPVVMDLEIGGEAVDPWGTKKIGFTATTTINRKDYGLVWNKNLDKGGAVLGDEVEIQLDIEADGAKVKQAAAH